MRTIIHLEHYIPVILGICIGISSCKNVESDIGSSFFQSHANLVEVDTVTATLETIYLDSMITNNTGVILLGSYNDSISGSKEASSYMQLGAPNVQSIEPTAVYDSLRFLMKPNRYIAGDSTATFSFAVHPLKELITPAPNMTTLYNTSTFAYDPVSLGTWTGKIYPTRTDTIAVRLSDQLGQSLFSAIVSNPSSLSTDNLFTYNYLKGLVLTGTNNHAIFGFAAGDSSGFIRLYYHNASDAKSALYTDFKITQSNLQFNHVDNDRTNTPFARLSANDKAVNANATNGESVLQPLSNLAIRLDFPYLQNLLHLGRYVEILSAQLTIRPKTGTYSADQPLPPALSLCEVQDDNTILDSLQGSSGGVQYGNLVTDYAYNHSYYTYDVTRYLLYEMQLKNNYDKTKLLLMLQSPTYSTTFRQLVLENKSAAGNGIEVSIELVMYNTQ
jgi:hypothetical protein